MADHEAEGLRWVEDGVSRPPAAVELSDVAVAFGDVRALDGVSLRVEPGERVAVIGPSGAGKSTLFAVLTRSAPLARGRVCVHGRDLFALGQADLRAARRRTGVLDQAYGLVPQLSAGLNVALGELAGAGRRATVRAFFAGPERAVAERAVDALGRLGLADRVGAAAGTLSGGQQQRVAVARLIVQRPDLLLADEPVAAVDRASAELVLEALDELAEAGATLMLSSHDVALARRLPRVVALRAGRVVFDGPPEGLDERMLGGLYAGTEAASPGPLSRERDSPPRSPSVLAPGAGGREGHGLRAR